MIRVTQEDMQITAQTVRDAAKRGDSLDTVAALFAYCQQLRAYCEDLEDRLRYVENSLPSEEED